MYIYIYMSGRQGVVLVSYPAPMMKDCTDETARSVKAGAAASANASVGTKFGNPSAGLACRFGYQAEAQRPSTHQNPDPLSLA